MELQTFSRWFCASYVLPIMQGPKLLKQPRPSNHMPERMEVQGMTDDSQYTDSALHFNTPFVIMGGGA